MCRHDKPQHVDFKVLPDKTLQLLCSWFEGGGLSLWPFYSTIIVSLSNTELYDSVAELAGIPRGALEEKSEFGEGKEAETANPLVSADAQSHEPASTGRRITWDLGACQQDQKGSP